MKYEIEVKETVSKYITYTIDVVDEDAGESIADLLEERINNANHPDEVIGAFEDAGVKILETLEGVEDVEYEMY